MIYPVWKTSLIDMGDFGAVVGLYFSTLQKFAIMTFIAGLINIPALDYLNFDNYSPDGRHDIPILLKASVICTAMTWETCFTCTESDWDPSKSTD